MYVNPAFRLRRTNRARGAATTYAARNSAARCFPGPRVCHVVHGRQLPGAVSVRRTIPSSTLFLARPTVGRSWLGPFITCKACVNMYSTNPIETVLAVLIAPQLLVLGRSDSLSKCTFICHFCSWVPFCGVHSSTWYTHNSQ